MATPSCSVIQEDPNRWSGRLKGFKAWVKGVFGANDRLVIISCKDTQNKMKFSRRVNLEVFLYLNVSTKEEPKSLLDTLIEEQLQVIENNKKRPKQQWETDENIVIEEPENDEKYDTPPPEPAPEPLKKC